MLLALPALARADLFGFWGHPPAHSPEKSDGDDEDDDGPRLTFAPAPWQQRGTLLKWNYGEGDEGGPKLDEPLVTDRPDFTDSSVTVGWGITQVEMGYTYTRNRDAGVTGQTHSYPEILLRQGMIADWFELRLNWDMEQAFDNLGGPQTGVTHDLELGCKLALTPQHHWLPETAVVLELGLPTGSNQDLVLPGINYLYNWEFNKQVSLAGSTGGQLQVDPVSDRTYSEFHQSFSLSLTFNEKLGGFIEWYVLTPAGAESVLPEQYADTGLKYLVNNNLQFDVRVGAGLNHAADNLFAGAGVCARR